MFGAGDGVGSVKLGENALSEPIVLYIHEARTWFLSLKLIFSCNGLRVLYKVIRCSLLPLPMLCYLTMYFPTNNLQVFACKYMQKHTKGGSTENLFTNNLCSHESSFVTLTFSFRSNICKWFYM